MNGRRNHELGAFLTARRARLRPDAAGLPPGAGRRVPGLRREEVATLAGVSPDYYTRLEQGRQETASASVLDALAGALRLSEEERVYLYTLAGAAPSARAAPIPHSGPVDDQVGLVLAVLGDTPAMVCGPFVDVPEMNEAACFLFTDFSAIPPNERNGVRWMLLSPLARELYREQWEKAAGEMVGMLRIDIGRYPGQPRGELIVAELLERSPLFRELWTEHHVSTWHTLTKTLHHPHVGTLRFSNASLTVNGVTDQTIYLVIPDDRPAFEVALRSARAELRG